MGRFSLFNSAHDEGIVFFAHSLRVLNDIFDPSKATSARPRKLGLRPQTPCSCENAGAGSATRSPCGTLP